MNTDCGRFDKLSDKEFGKAKEEEIQALAKGVKPKMPTVQIGEIVEIKMVRFKVIGLKTNGRLRLKMLRDSEPGKIGEVLSIQTGLKA